MNLKHCCRTLELAGVACERGLSHRELSAAEVRFGFVFPPDLRDLLSFALPTGPDFPKWRKLDDTGLLGAFEWPLEGICFDIEHSNFWPTEWGARPSDIQEAFEVARQQVESAPRLIPIFAHRYLPDRPASEGNPVFSVNQTDIIYYGGDLENYLHNEYHHYFGPPEYTLPSQIRYIEFWSWLVERNV